MTQYGVCCAAQATLPRQSCVCTALQAITDTANQNHVAATNLPPELSHDGGEWRAILTHHRVPGVIDDDAKFLFAQSLHNGYAGFSHMVIGGRMYLCQAAMSGGGDVHRA